MDHKNDLQPPVKRTYFLEYMGQLNLHRSYASVMSRWLTAAVKYRRKPQFCALTVDQDFVSVAKEEKVLIDLSENASGAVISDTKASNRLTAISNLNHPLAPTDTATDEEESQHCFGILPLKLPLEKIVEITSATDYERRCFSFFVDKGLENPLECHVFYENDVSLIDEVGETLNKFISWHKNSSPSASMISRNVKLEDLDSVRFEVMLLGKLQVKHEQQPYNFVDEAVGKYHSLEMEHVARMEEMKMINALNQSYENGNIHEHKNDHHENSMMTSELLHPIQINSLEIKDRRPSLDEVRQRCNSTDISQIAAMKRRKGRTRHCSEPSTAASLGFDKNKTRLLQIGKQSVTLICPDLTSRNVEIHFVDIQRCCQGIKCRDHFGVFVKDHHHHHSSIRDEFKFKCFLFKCADENVCDEIMLALRQACHTCNHGPDPMKKFHSLCKRIHSTSGSSADASWVERGVTLAAKCVAEFFCDADQKKAKQRIEERCKEELPKTHYEHLVVVMDIARQMFEEKQREHDIRIKQLRDSNGANVVSKKITLIKSRAKKSFTSFENFLGKGIQKMQELQQEAEHHIVSPVDKFKFTFADVPRSAPSTPVSNNTATAQAKRSRNRSGSPASFTDVSPLVGGEGSRNIALPEPIRPRSKTAEAGSIDQSSLNVRRKLQLNQDNSESVLAPSVAKTSASNMNSRSISTESTPAQSRSSTPVLKDLSPHLRGHSTGKKLTIHQEMFYKIGTPRKRKGSKTFDSPSMSEYLKPTSIINTPEAVRLAWRRAIQDQIILNRINRISSSSELDGSSANVPANMKLDYPEPDICPPAMNDVWIELLETDERNQYKIDQSVLHAAVRKGVPRALRGRVWSMLYEQWKLRLESTQRPLTSKCKLVKTPYHELLKLLTSEQHAILIDLGRTFPTYPYYSQQLGNGQLALFNVLKAYSLADVDVGYCQGLSFVAGLLLMHMPSSNEAFSMLCHLMAGMGCRKLYLPDMEALRVAVYQLSRLLHDFHKDLYDHLEKNDVTMMLFAAPWFLTMFASVLSFGFTARIFDLLFLEGTSALFKAALCLLSHHKKNILEEDGFESVVGYLKDKLPDMDDSSVKQVLSEIFDLNIEEKLRVYEVEYSVLEEGELFGFDESDGSPQDDAKDLRQKYDRLEQVHQTVTKFNVELVEQLEAARMQISSLQQGLTDMATMDEKRTLELESLKQVNESLKERQKV
ncbi:unnamed protein product [Clavelina lepadiformis]|uniref:Rab-GAP TBC domain-containing protein n=1 Tax=Clavelina lepadiformis TaxID=159417 RepID=A0ABP0FXI1_CLALP